MEEFGTIDTWVNNAGVSFFGRLTDALRMELEAALSPGKALLAAGLGLAVFAGIRSLAGSDDD